MTKTTIWWITQKINIACDIAHKPELIFLDEPTVAVDPQSRNSILEGIKELNKNGATVVYTTHYMEEVEQLCNRIAILDKGKVIALGTKEALKELTTMGEKITVEAPNLKKAIVSELKTMENIIDVKYEDATLFVTYKKGEDNLEKMISFLKENNVKYTKIFSELPTLN